MTMNDTMLPELMKKDGIDGLAHPIDDLGESGEIIAPIDDKLGEGSAMIGGETGGSMLPAGGGDMMVGGEGLSDTGTECAAPDGQEIGVESDMMPQDEVERDRSEIEQNFVPEMAMAGGSEV